MTELVKLLSDHFEVPEAKINSDTHLLNDLEADSLDCVELSMIIEEEFDIHVSDDTMVECKTVGAINTVLITKKVEAQLGTEAAKCFSKAIAKLEELADRESDMVIYTFEIAEILGILKGE